MEYHCEYCQCPKGEWKKCLKTYDGNECVLHQSFISLIEDGMTAEELTKLALVELPKEFADLLSPIETVKEMVEIVVSCEVIG